MKKNLENINKDESWLIKNLKIKGYNDLKDILLATIDVNEKLVVFNKKEVSDVKNILE